MKAYLLAGGLPIATLCLGLSAHAGTTTINGGGSTNSQPVYTSEFTTYSTATPSILFSYDGVSSSVGQSAFLNNDIALFNSPSTQYGTQVGTTVHFGASDQALTSSQISGYTLSAQDGPLIQVPTFGVAVAIPFENTGLGKSLILTDGQLCSVFSGKFTNWNQVSKKATAGTIQVIYRSDSAAATFLLTQHFNAVCTAANSSFPTIPVPITKTFASLFTGGVPPSNFIGESGSSLEASTTLDTPLSMGYVSPDYTAIAPNSSNTSALPDAVLKNGVNNVNYSPSVANIEAGLENPGAGSTNPTPPSTEANAANPLLWVPTVPVTNKGYPIVGYSTWDVSSCYASKTVGKNINTFLTDNYNSKTYQTDITNQGSAPLENTAASPYASAVIDTFLSNKSGYNLNIDNATLCSGKTGR